jgi:hypothetical protein
MLILQCYKILKSQKVTLNALQQIQKVPYIFLINFRAKKLCHPNMAKVKQLSIEKLIRTR